MCRNENITKKRTAAEAAAFKNQAYIIESIKDSADLIAFFAIFL